MTYISIKTNILVAFGAVKQTTNIPTVIARVVKRANEPTAVAVGCLDQHEYSLINNILYIMMIEKKRK
jgi:hypothetical protein